MAKETVPQRPLVSVITAVLNGEKTIEKTIQSVLGQSYDLIEYIIIDGGSTDRTQDIIRKYEKGYSGRIRWISEPDNGISDAWNKGIRMASGELVGLINADDWYEVDAVEKIIRRRTENQAIICGNVRLWNSHAKFTLKRSSLPGIESKMTIWHPGMFCPRQIYAKIGLYDTGLKVFMDYDFVVRCYLNAVQFRMVNECVADMRFGGISNRLISLSMREALKIKNTYFGTRIRHFYEYVFFQIYFHAIIFIKKLMYGERPER